HWRVHWRARSPWWLPELGARPAPRWAGLLRLPGRFPAAMAGEALGHNRPILCGLLGKRCRGLTYRGISYLAHQPSVATYIDAQQGWLYAYPNFNRGRFSPSPAVEMTMAVGARPTLGPFEFDIGAAYYYYPGELGPELSNYWEAHATVSYKTDRQDHAGTDPRPLPQRLADRRLGHLRRRHVLVRSAERTPPRRRGLDAVR